MKWESMLNTEGQKVSNISGNTTLPFHFGIMHHIGTVSAEAAGAVLQSHRLRWILFSLVFKRTLKTL